MKVLFLDVDGVLNSTEWAIRVGGYGYPPALNETPTREILKWDPSCVERLRSVIDTTGAKIVISSAWRGYGIHAIDHWRRMFSCYEWPEVPVIGETPNLRVQAPNAIRGDEVNTWIIRQSQPIERYICLDDDSDFGPDQRLIQTNPVVGMTDADASACIIALTD